MAHLAVRISKILKSRLRCPAPAEAMMASRCSCRSPSRLGALMGPSLTWVERCDSCLAASLLSHCIAGFLASASTPDCACCLGSLHACGHRPELLGIRAVVQRFLCFAAPAAPPPTSPSMALLIDPLAVRAQALLPRCSSAAVLFSSQCFFLPSVLLTQSSSNEIVHFSCFTQL